MSVEDFLLIYVCPWHGHFNEMTYIFFIIFNYSEIFKKFENGSALLKKSKKENIKNFFPTMLAQALITTTKRQQQMLLCSNNILSLQCVTLQLPKVKCRCSENLSIAGIQRKQPFQLVRAHKDSFLCKLKYLFGLAE